MPTPWNLPSIFIVALMAWAPTLACRTQALPQESAAMPEISTMLMNSTFKITGPSKKVEGENSYGTAFILLKPIPDSSRGFYVLVTAAHVLDNIKGEEAVLALRRRDANGVYTEFPVRLHIRDGFRSFYIRSLEADVAVAYIEVPVEVKVDAPPTAFLVDDERISHLEIHPGDEMFTLGFPLYASLNTFPVLRSGIVASFPLTPMKSVALYYLNFRIFEGNSGGPAYFEYDGRTYAGALRAGRELGILGIVSKQLTSSLTGERTPLDVSVLVPSAFISDAIQRLPLPPTSSTTIKSTVDRGR